MQEFSARGDQRFGLGGASALRRSAGRSARCRTAGRGASDPPRTAAARPARRRRHRRSAAGAAHTADAAPGPRGPLALTMVYRGDAATSCGHRYPSRGKEMQDQGHPQRRIPADVQRRHITPPLPSPPIDRTLVSNGTGHVRLAHRRPDQPGARRPAPHPRPPGWSKDSPPRSAVPPHCCVDPTLPGPRRRACSPRRSPARSRPPAPGGPRRDPPRARCRRRVSRTSRPSSPRFSGTGSGGRGKRPSGSRLMPLTRQPSRSSSGRIATAPAPRTQSSATWKPRRADRGDVDHRQREDRVEVPRDAPRDPRRTSPSPSQPIRGGPSLRQRAHRGAGLGIEEDAVGPDELERVPLDRIVARGEDQPGRRRDGARPRAAPSASARRRGRSRPRRPT